MLQVVLGTSFEEDVCFVEEQDGLPASDEVEDFGKTVFELLGVETKISGTYLSRVSEQRNSPSSSQGIQTRKSGRF